MYKPEGLVGRGSSMVWELGWMETVSTSRVGSELLSRAISCLVNIHLESLLQE